MFPKLKRAALALPLVSLVLLMGCGTPTPHPNQLNAFDGATYDSLTVAHGALGYLRAVVPEKYPSYVPVFNQANAAYGVAFTAYSSFRAKPVTQAQVALAIGNLAVAVVTLENAFQIGLHANAEDVARIRRNAKRLRTSAKQAGITVSDILTELEIAAAVAQTIPQASQYAALAQMVIGCANAALYAEAGASGQPIDLSLIAPLPAL